MKLRFRPSVPINLQNSILAMTLKLTEGVLEYRQGRTAETRKRKRARHETTKGVRHVSKNSRLESGEKMDTDNFDHATSATEIAQSPEAVDGDMGANISGASSAATPTPHEAPSVLQHLTIGINEVTRRLEAQIKSSRQIVSISDKGAVSSEPLTSPAIKVVLVCRADIDPPILIDHLPHLVAACNSPQKTHSSSGGSSAFVKLVPLPKGAELSLAEAMGLRRVAVMAINVRCFRIRTHACADYSISEYCTRPCLSRVVAQFCTNSGRIMAHIYFTNHFQTNKRHRTDTYQASPYIGTP